MVTFIPRIIFKRRNRPSFKIHRVVWLWRHLANVTLIPHCLVWTSDVLEF